MIHTLPNMLHSLPNEKMPQFICDTCNFICSKKSNYDKHTSTRKHMISTNVICVPIEKTPQLNCEKCNISCTSKRDYDRHLATQKHTNMRNTTQNDDNIYNCNCGSTYKYSSSYYRHKKTCNYVKSDTTTPETQQSMPIIQQHDGLDLYAIINLLIKENQEIRNLVITQHNTLNDQSKTLADQNKTIIDQNKTLVDQNKTLTELVKNQQPTTNNSHNNNNTNYNITMFLSEKCKDAKNMTDFIEVLKTKVDMFQIEETGYVDGISKLFIQELNSMEVTERPLHCTDERRNTFYVHNNDTWNKDQDLKDTKKAINHVSHANLQQCLAWSMKVPPGGADREEHINRSIRLCKEANRSSDDTKVDKIIKNISKEIPLNKQVMNDV